MTRIYYTVIVLLLLSACSNKDTNWGLQKTTIASGISDVDSLLQVKWGVNDRKPSQLLFNIACGGNLEYLTDTIIHKAADEDFAIISIADYFQEHQLFYIIYDIQNNQLKQSRRIYLPNWDISAFSKIQITDVTTDFLYLKTSAGIMKSEKLEPMVYDQHKIINYYEFE